MQQGQHEFEPEGYYQYWNYAERKGYSGTAVFSRIEPLEVTYDLGYDTDDTIDREGRVITLEYDDFFWSTSTPPTRKPNWLGWMRAWDGTTLSALIWSS